MKRLSQPQGRSSVSLLVAVMFSTALLAPLFIPAEAATRMHMTARLKPPSAHHWLGTDQLGRDLLYRVMLGAQTSLTIAVSAVLISLAARPAARR